MKLLLLFPLALCLRFTTALRYDPRYTDWNLNFNQTATDPLDYYTAWDNHTYAPSPSNWRFPFYSFFLDRFVNGDPTNDNINGTQWEHDPYGTQLRHGGDVQGLEDSLDYLHGLGIRGLYIAGSLLMNRPWEADSYSPLDHTHLDHHFGNIEQWRKVIDTIHTKGMYVILDDTMSTMSDLIGFEGYLNSSTPWSYQEHNAQWKSSIEYSDWEFGNKWYDECPWEYPRFWTQAGVQYPRNDTDQMVGCRDSEFDQYGDVGAFGQYPEWQKEMSKFNSVQDRLRDWRPSVQSKLQHFYCMIVKGLDIDGFRIDKALQVTADGQGNFSHAMRQCAHAIGKHNFFIPGEIVNGNANAAVYLGRGKEPSMWVDNITEAVTTNSTYIRSDEHHALDAGAFHYTTYRGLMRYLGLDGDLLAANDGPVNFVNAWSIMQQSNDFVNANNGQYDPRHMYGASNQDVLRWPGMINGTERQLSGAFITTMLMPGISLMAWGEEQAFYVLDNTAANYIYGRQAMSSAQAWQMHGCYKVGDINLSAFPVNSSSVGCQDDSVSLDHRDPTHPVYNVYKMMFEMRRRYPVLNDGFVLEQLSNQTFNYTLPGSFGVPTETGIWSSYRGAMSGVQDFTGEGAGNQPVWLLYTNYNETRDFNFDCTNVNNQALVAPFSEGTTVKNLFYPYDEWTLQTSNVSIGVNGSTGVNGCLPFMNMTMYGYKAFVPIGVWEAPSPMISKLILNDTYVGHDQRILSGVPAGQSESITMELRFTEAMDCDSVRNSISIASTTDDGTQAKVDTDSTDCLSIDPIDLPYFYSGVPTTWRYRANVTGIQNGIHTITVNNASSQSTTTTNSIDHIMFRIGQADNPMVFPKSANYSSELLFKQSNEKRDTESESGFYVQHKAAGADKWRYTLTWNSVWSEWLPYTAGNSTLAAQTWSGTKVQKWDGDHVKVQYWSSAAGSSDHIQEGDLYASGQLTRRYPHLFIHGPFNQYGYDSGVKNSMSLKENSTWQFDFMTEWPAQFQVNVWGMTEDGTPDVGYAYGDVDNDTVLDRLAPSSLEESVVNITNNGPQSPYLAWRIMVNDGSHRYWLEPTGNRWRQLALFILFAIVPPLLAVLGVWAYLRAFYQVKFNQVGLENATNMLPIAFTKHFSRFHDDEKEVDNIGSVDNSPMASNSSPNPGSIVVSGLSRSNSTVNLAASAGLSGKRQMVLIGTMEYDIEDWKIKIKIGGLGVMAQLMGKHLKHKDLIWVVPCVGGIDYPVDTPAEPMLVTILGKQYEVQVQYHKLDNITYVLLDAPVFRQQTSKEPYPARMDDLDSSIYYSAWNQCIAEAGRRFPIDLYHINDYHGTVAPLYWLPKTIPCCLSLHNAEFQGLWPMRNPKESAEVCSVFNLPEKIVSRYVQFGEIFNLLHAGASILRLHQKGFGAVGVSKKYGKRSWARYPIFWGLKSIGALPNPDPSDIAEWDKKHVNPHDIVIDKTFEGARAGLKRKAQEWAGLEQRDDADLFVFVGRWSMQKGIDLIADVFPAILDKHPHTQLMCIGPCIDLYGKFAALKLSVMMKKYPGRVYSKPEFTALPPFIFSGAEFALIPSRDEPFGLVAVEFGRKGALGVGSRVGGLGQMPGWWYTIESTTTKHQVQQFKMAISAAIKSSYETRALMRARSAKQRFPVAQWTEDLDILQNTSIKVHNRQALSHAQHSRSSMKMAKRVKSGTWTPSEGMSGAATPNFFGWMTPKSGMQTPITPYSRTPAHSRPATRHTSPVNSRPNTRPSSPVRDSAASSVNASPTISRRNSFSLGTRSGPGHVTHRVLHSALTSANLHRKQNSGNSVDNLPDLAKQLTRIDDEVNITSEEAHEAEQRARLQQLNFGHNPEDSPQTPSRAHFGQTFSLTSAHGTPGSQTPPVGLGIRSFSPPPPVPPLPGMARHEETPLSLDTVMNEKENKEKQDLLPFFTDPTGLYYRTFERKLEDLSPKNSENSLCIENYLETSEKQWFNRLHGARMSRHQTPAATPSQTPAPTAPNSREGSIHEFSSANSDSEESMAQFLLPSNYKAPSGLRRFMQYKTGDWPVYAWFLALGQILAANSYQIVLLTGTVGEAAVELYIVASIYLVASLAWWYCFRRLPCLYTVSVPWFFYSIAFFLLAIAPWVNSTLTRGWIQYVATGFYAFASASGSFFFAQNFGSQGSTPVKTWGARACMIQGTQQIWIVVLWFWGSKITSASQAGSGASALATYGWPLTAICAPVSILLFTIGTILFLGLPDFYRQAPGAVPSFYRAVLRRKIIVWFFIAIFIQNYFLSAPYGRNWSYLWSSKHAPAWTIILLIVLFFVILWALALYLFSHLSATHSWLIPIFAIGLGAPRWAQILWSTSNIGTYLPWAGSPLASALLGRGLWLWLGLLDSIQGVGFGMILLQTLTRYHLTFTLVAAQIFGSVGTILARATAPDATGPGNVFPDFSVDWRAGLAQYDFWICLVFQGIVCVGFFLFFRKEQLSKP